MQTITTMATEQTMVTSSNDNIFRVTGHLCRELTGQRWIPRTKASDAEHNADGDWADYNLINLV